MNIGNMVFLTDRGTASSGGIFGGTTDRLFLAGRVFVHKLQFFIAI